MPLLFFAVLRSKGRFNIIILRTISLNDILSMSSGVIKRGEKSMTRQRARAVLYELINIALPNESGPFNFFFSLADRLCTGSASKTDAIKLFSYSLVYPLKIRKKLRQISLTILRNSWEPCSSEAEACEECSFSS